MNDDDIIYKFPKAQTCLTKLKKCFKHFYFNQKETTPKKYYITKWRKYLSKEVNTPKELNDPFELLTRLWAHKSVIHELEDIRLNPNLLNKKQIRNDLEFYIPQLCSFMIFGEYEIVQELFSFLCKSCYVSFSFAHRIIWFIKSSMNQDPQFSDRIRKMLSIIQTIFKSDRDKDIIEDLFLSGSKEYIDYLDKQALKKEYFSYQMITIGKSDKELNEQLDKRNNFYSSKANFRKILDNYIDHQYAKEINKEKSDQQQQGSQQEIISDNNFEVNPQDIYLTLFERYDFVTNDEDSVHIQFTKQIDINDVNLSSFLSNINFIDQLCNISEILMFTDQSQQKKTLINELRKVNKVLPSNVYLPFMNRSMRNYVVSSIPISEARIFRTKTRAPYMITVECFRLDEVTYNLKDSNSFSGETIAIDSDSIYHNIAETETDINKKTNDNSLNHIKDIKDSSSNNKDSNSIYSINHLKNKSDFFIEKKDSKKHKAAELYENVMLNNDYQFNEIDNNNNKQENNTKSLQMYLMENEVKYSKPIIIRNLIRRTGSSTVPSSSSSLMGNIGGSSSNQSKEKGGKTIKYDYDTITTTEIESSSSSYYPNQLITGTIISTSINSTTSKDETIPNSKCEQIDNTIKTKFNPQIELNIENTIDNNINDNVFISKTPRMRSIDITISSSSSPNGQHSLSDDQEDSKSDEDKDKEIENDNIYSSQLETQGREYDINKIFGETMEQKTERLRKVSPFGKLATYKLFNIIVKSGEDLRQEQFATQLINEFFQIFKFEKVQCWLQPYEIIATGTDVGLVEVVPNAISLDQLKHRAKTVNSLQEFYNTFYGPIGSDQHKTAMKNYIQSLAGYSLVCYFLQIKDRHNANILIDDKGHLVHIDFGFMLSNSPGKGLKFEKAPFKLTQEFVDVMGGTNSIYFDKYRKLLWKGFIALSKHYEKILILVEMMYCGHGNNLPCFQKGQDCIRELRSRFIPKKDMRKRDYIAHVDLLISQSLGNWTTKWYDKYQYYFQGILA